MTESLQKRAEAVGIQTSYNDVWGNAHQVPETTLNVLLEALGNPKTDQVLPPVKVINEKREIAIPIAGAKSWQLDKGQQGPAINGQIILPKLDKGYYELTVTTADQDLKTFLIVAPSHCWIPKDMDLNAAHKRQRVWGVAAQLYSIRSERNWGIGDFTDLAELVKMAAAKNADVVGLNPLHAMFPNNPHSYSPYSPSNRLFLNIIYIDVEAIEGFAKSDELTAKIEAARQSELVDYMSVATIKREVLEQLFTQQNDSQNFASFVSEQGERLNHQALFDALSEHFVKQNIFNWHEWPSEFQKPDSPEVQAFAANHKQRIEFYKWVQFIADSQLAKVQNLALQNNMKIGLYRDLAVGSEGAGAEIWIDPDSYINGVTIGAPPDEYNPKGQNWGLPPLNPKTLIERGFKPFIDLLRANMRHARALRIDHAFGLSRLFLIPNGRPASEGAYLTYPFEEMLAVLKVESHLNQCIVIGEDLGTFPPNYKQLAADAGVLSYKVLYFERDENGFTQPNKYPPLSLATLSTHDLPTLKGWLSGADIEERAGLNLYPSEDLLHKDRDNRTKDKPLLEQALGDNNSFEAAETFLAKSASAIVMVQLEDLLGLVQQMNIPATTNERANWRMKLPVSLENLKFAELAKFMNEARQEPLVSPPRATYRLQLHKDFTFYDAVKIIPYLAELGISHVYTSSYLKARPGSTHGYDVIDHNSFNPELGGENGYRAFIDALNAHGLKQILDFVPNHMGVGADNEWWMDVLENGRNSPRAKYFDIDWRPRSGAVVCKVILPALGDLYGKVLAAGELKVAYENDKFYVKYFDNKFPIRPEDYPLDIEAVNTDNTKLHELLERQHYKLVFWRVASSEINYRRFFDINELAGLRVEEPELFDQMHKLVLSLIDKGELHGLRIDHIDGLANPAEYCRKLKEKAGSQLYLTVEKILASHENLREDWQIEGTSGYDALNLIGAVFVDSRNQKLMDRVYRRVTGMAESFTDMVYQAKLKIMETTLASELVSLSLLLKSIADNNIYSRDYTLDILRQSLKEIIGYFPVYRSYVTEKEITEDDARVINWALGKAKKASQLPETGVYDFVAGILLRKNDFTDYESLIFIRKFQQLSGPVMAKGLEDTSFYRYNRLISLNEVGGDPSRFGISIKAFHHINQTRADKFPHSMITTSTHDTKRGEDARARISVLSEMPKDWGKMVVRWHKLNRSRHSEIDGKTVPSPNEEYYIYQSLIGSWPDEMLDSADETQMAEYIKRLKEFATKSLREAKVNSSWAMPNETYETAVHNFISGILDVSKPNLFIDDFLPVCRQIATNGKINSLSQLTLKLTIPGVPDIYQGTEYFDYSLVDPDNRRPVDYDARIQSLAETISLDNLQDNKTKQQLLKLLLTHRKNNAGLYANGTYKALRVTGKYKNHILAFIRENLKQKLLVIIPVRTIENWSDTAIKLPKGSFKNIITNETQYGGSAMVSGLFTKFPLAVLEATY